MDVFQNWLNQLAQELKLNEILAKKRRKKKKDADNQG